MPGSPARLACAIVGNVPVGIRDDKERIVVRQAGPRAADNPGHTRPHKADVLLCPHSC